MGNYVRWQSNDDPVRRSRHAPHGMLFYMEKYCDVQDCDHKFYGRGLCEMHYQRLTRTGRLGLPSPAERFVKRVAIGAPDECWPWTAGFANKYGCFYPRGGEQVKAHRYAYELWVGEIPPGLQVDHLCSNKACCNPRHLEPVTRAENGRRAWARGEQPQRAKPTSCRNGHPYDEENPPYVRNTGAWGCRACRNQASRRFRAKVA